MGRSSERHPLVVSYKGIASREIIQIMDKATTPAKILAEQTNGLPDSILQEVLDFVGYLRMKHNLPLDDDWDKQIQQDSASGAFHDAFADLAEAALTEHRSGQTKPL